MEHVLRLTRLCRPDELRHAARALPSDRVDDNRRAKEVGHAKQEPVTPVCAASNASEESREITCVSVGG